MNDTCEPLFFSSDSFSDGRGLFDNIFRRQSEPYSLFWGNRMISQINISVTNNVGTVRGLHFQNLPHAEAKIVRCLRGNVWDVIVDLRQNSDFYGQWKFFELDANKNDALFIPEGFAHGFQVLKPNSHLLYIHSGNWVKSAETGVRFDDPQLSISWPLTPKGMSERDLSLPFLKAL